MIHQLEESISIPTTPSYSKIFDIKSLEKEYIKTANDTEYQYNPFSIEKQQCYNPIYSSLFDCENETQLENMIFNSKYNFVNMNTVEEVETKQYINKPVFIKFSPLLDPIKYMIGKYDKYGDTKMEMPEYGKSKFAKLDNIHNASYVDCFFSYLSSCLLHEKGFPHAIDFYGCNLGVQSKYKMNIYDDLEYLNNSPFFTSNTGKLFHISDYEDSSYLNNTSRDNKVKLTLNDTKHNLTNISVIDLEDIGDVSISTLTESTKTDFPDDTLPEEVYEKSQSLKSHSSCTSSNNSELNYSTDDNEDAFNENDNSDDDSDFSTIDDDDEDDENETTTSNSKCSVDESNNDDSTENDPYDEPQIFAYINNFPVQMICLEKCEGTMDELFIKNKLDVNSAASALFQIVMTLLMYQNVFQFTHNDLHTNNIMYVSTEEEYLYYKYKGINYKVPTYGKIFKLIDFGRSIYKINGITYCSDSFAPGGDAHSQYNFEPFFDEKKPRLEPNYSFDLCRLGCSIYDFIMEMDENNILCMEEEDMDELQKTIYRWCLDDNRKNVLYKKNGEERYPEFKLYKMIARTVHQHTPEAQLSFPFFSQFAVPSTHENICEKNSTIIIESDEHKTIKMKSC
jgi:hypothetical protein